MGRVFRKAPMGGRLAVCLQKAWIQAQKPDLAEDAVAGGFSRGAAWEREFYLLRLVQG